MNSSVLPGDSLLTRVNLAATDNLSFICTQCPVKRSFKNRSQLKIHELFHTGERPFQCQTCGKAFFMLSHLKAHERIHSGEKPFKCSMCPKQFTENSHRKQHERTHGGDKPFICDVCGRKFTQRGNAVKHVQKQHNEELSAIRSLMQLSDQADQLVISQ